VAKASSLSKFELWHKSNQGLLAFGLAELLLTLLIGMRALDTGSLIQYFLAFIFLVGGIQNMIRLASNVIHGKH
jgi:hypothetical protein